jgi:hypothetical protein
MTEVVLHRPDPPRDEPPYTRYCLECHLPWPCPDRLDAIEPPPPVVRRDLEVHERALLARVGLCWHIEGCHGMRYHQRNGGTVVGYHDDGDERRYQVLAWHQGRPITVELTLGDIEPRAVSEPNQYVLENHAVALAEYVGKGNGSSRDKLEWLRLATICMERAI